MLVHAIYEPPQQGSAERLTLERGTAEEAAADALAAALGWRKVGWIFAQSSKEREFIFSSEEVCQVSWRERGLACTCVRACARCGGPSAPRPPAPPSSLPPHALHIPLAPQPRPPPPPPPPPPPVHACRWRRCRLRWGSTR